MLFSFCGKLFVYSAANKSLSHIWHRIGHLLVPSYPCHGQGTSSFQKTKTTMIGALCLLIVAIWDGLSSVLPKVRRSTVKIYK
jgi:hypothetical protein